MYSFEKLEPRILLSADLLPLAPDAQAIEAPDNSVLHVSVVEETEVLQVTEDTSTSPSVPPLTQVDFSVTTEVESPTDQSTQPELTTTLPESEETEEESTETGAPETEFQDKPTELVFINDDIEAAEPLIADILLQNDTTKIIVLDGTSDGIEQITDTLAGYDSIDALHFLSHGTSGTIKLGNSWLNSENIGDYAESISSWGNSLSENGDILLYGCDLASDQDGRDLVTELGNLTGADVAASTDTTGHELLSGDWVLEYQSGDIEADIPLSKELQDDWVHILAEETIADDFNTGLYNNNTGTLPWASDWMEIGETTDPNAGTVLIDTGRLSLYTADDFEFTRGISRVVDLSNAASAYLSFDYEVIPVEYSGHVSLQIRPEGDPIWHGIGDYWTSWVLNDSELIDISSYTSAGTEIQFLSSNLWSEGGFSWGNDNFFVDNLRIDYTTSTWSSPLWLTTSDKVTSGGQQGIDTWNQADFVGIGNPDLSLGTETSGSFSLAARMSSFAANKQINALHYVSRDIQIGSSNFQLQKGDILFASADAQAADFGGLDVQKEDIVLFRPSNEGDYGAGTFQILFADLTGGGDEIRGITLIEQAVTVGGKDLNGGDLLFVRSGGAEDQCVWLYETIDVEPGGTTDGTISILLDGHDTGVDISERLTGIDLVEEKITVGGKTLNSGTILLSVDNSDTIGSTDVEKFDIFALEVSSASDPTGVTDIGMATASLFFDGSDVSFNDNEERIDGFSLTLAPEQGTNTITGGVFNAENNTLTLTGTDFTYTGGPGTDITAYMDWSKFVWDINGDGAITPNITFSSSDFSSVVVTNGTTLTLILTAAKAGAILATTGYGGVGGIDTLDITTGFSGNDSGEYSTTDGLSDGPLTTITAPTDITISSSSIDENIDTTTGITVGTLSAIDPDFGDNASYTIVGGADGGLFSIGGPGADELILSDGLLNHETQDSYLVTVRATDSHGLFHDQTLTVSVNDINEVPVIENNSLTLEEGETVVLSSTDLSATDPESADNSLSFTVSLVLGGRFEHVSAPGTAITAFLQADIVSGNISFVHDGGEAAPTYAVSVTDGSLSTAPASPIITFTPRNDAPAFVNNVLTISEGGTVTLNNSNLQVSDLDNGDADLNLTASNVVGGQFELVASPGTAIFSFTQLQVSSGQVQFIHNGGEAAPGYDLTVNDGSDTIGPDSANVAYTPLNDAPSIQNNGLTLLQGETIVLSGIHLQSLDPDDLPGVLTYTVSGVTAGQFELVSSPGFAITGFTQFEVDTGTIQFVHDNSATAPSYLVQVFDDDGLTDGPEPAAISFNTVNQAPVLQNNSLTIDEDTTIVLSAAELSATDSDNSDTTLIFTVSGVTKGQFELLTNPSVAITSFNQADITGGRILFVHDGSEAAPEYNVTVTDGALSDGPAAATINFTKVNDAPVLGNNAITIDEAGTVVLNGSNLSATDVESVDGDLTFTVSDVTGGRFTTVAAPTITITSFTQSQVLAAEIQFIHDGGEAPPAYRAAVSDSLLSDGPENASVVFNSQNDAPVLITNSLTVNEGSTVTLSSSDLSATDIDNIDGNLLFNVSGVTGGQFERISAAGTAITSFTQSEIVSGEILFIDDGDETNPIYSVTVSDTSLTSPSDPATITFIGENDAPLLGNNSLTISEGGSVILTGSDLSATDIDNSDPALQFIISGITGGQFELVSAPSVAITSFTQADVTGGQVRFVDDGEEAPPSYRVMAYDGSLVSNQQTASVTFNSVNDKPTATNLSLVESYTEDTAKTLAPIVISDVDSGTIYSATFTLSDAAAGSFITDSVGTANSTFGSGVLSVSGTGLSDVNALLSSVVFTPSPNYNSNFTIGISVTDGIGAPLTGTRAMAATPVNDAPAATNTTYTGNYVEDSLLPLQDITVTDVDAGEIVTATLTLANPTYGSLSTSGGATYDTVSGIWQITDTVTNVNSALAGIDFIPTANISHDTYIELEIKDGLENGVGALTGRIDLTASSVGDTPLVESISTLPSAQSGLIFISPNALDGPEVTHFQIVDITNGILYQQDGITQIASDDFITVSEGAAGVRFTPLAESDGSFGVLSSEDGITAAAQSSIATSTVSIVVPVSPPPTNTGTLPPDIAEMPPPENPEGTGSEETATDSGDTTAEAIVFPAEEPYGFIAELAAGQPPPQDASPVSEKSDSPDQDEPAEEDNSNDDGEPVLTIATEDFQDRSQADSFGSQAAPDVAEPFSIDLSFRDLSPSGFSMAFDQNDGNGISLSTNADDPSLFAVEDYKLLNLDYRQRTELEYENLRHSLDSFREQTKNEAALTHTIVGSAIAASTGLSAGYVVWLLRSGALLSSILSSLPAWQLADPLAILVGRRNESEEDEDDDSIESILTKNPDKTTTPENHEKSTV